MYLFLFFFKQKTAYEMRISDWSSDVCSSDLVTGSGSRLLQSSKVYDILSIQENGGNPVGKGEVSNPRKVLFATTAGVFELNLADGQVSYFLNENASESNRNTEVFCMQQVGDMIWMGTGGRGLTAAGPGGRLADMDWLNGELAGNVVFSMTRSGGSLLVGTGKGLSVIDLADSSVINYTTLNGLPAGEFNHSAVFGDSLQAYMGSVNGLVRW